MDTKMVSKSRVFLARIWLFIQGAIVGGAFHIILASLVRRLYFLLMQQPDWAYYLLGAIGVGPALVVGLFYPNISWISVQLISGLIFSGLAGIAFGLAGRKWGIVIFIALYTLLTACLAYLFGMIVMTG